MGAIVLSKARVGERCIIGAGAVVREGDVIPDGSLVVGVPGKVMKQLTPEQLKYLESDCDEYVKLSRRYIGGDEVKVAVGGTFQPLHDGHKALLRTAYGLAGDVDIGLTSDEMAHRARVRPVKSYAEREKWLREWIRKSLGVEPHIVKLKDPYGPTLNEDYDYLVVSPETYPIALKINELRKERKLKPIEIYRVEYVLAEDGKPISSTRVVQGEIDVHGNLLRKEGMNVAVGSTNPVKIKAVENVFRRVYGEVTVEARKVASGVSPQPFGKETVKGAINRAKSALRREVRPGRRHRGRAFGRGRLRHRRPVLRHLRRLDGSLSGAGAGSSTLRR